jgi:hypothetical protein
MAGKFETNESGNGSQVSEYHLSAMSLDLMGEAGKASKSHLMSLEGEPPPGQMASGTSNTDRANGIFDDRFSKVSVDGMTDAERADAQAIGHAVLGGSMVDASALLGKYKDDPAAMARVLESLNKSFEGEGIKFDYNPNEASPKVNISVTPEENTAIRGDLSVTIPLGNYASGSAEDQRRAQDWDNVQRISIANINHSSIDIPPGDDLYGGSAGGSSGSAHPGGGGGSGFAGH